MLFLEYMSFIFLVKFIPSFFNVILFIIIIIFDYAGILVLWLEIEPMPSCSGSMELQPLDHQGIPWCDFNLDFLLLLLLFFTVCI